jgi:hypothetical protein
VHDGVLEHAASFQIFDECSGGFIHAGRHGSVILLEIFMAIRIPPRKTVIGAAPCLHEADAAFEHAARD